LPQLFEALDINVINSLEQGAALAPQVAVIASPAPFHQQDALAMANRCSHIFLEKPLAADLPAGLELATELTRRNLITTIGYHLRCSETVTTLKHVLEQKNQKQLRSVKLRYQQHLSVWRPGIDPRNSVTARTELGGGVLLELSHEFDAIRFLLANVSTVDKCVLKFDNAPTDGVVETEAFVDLTLATGIAATVQLDMTSPSPIRLWEFIFDDKTISADLLNGSINMRLLDGSELRLHQSSPDERDRAGKSILSKFLDSYEFGTPPPCSLLDGLNALAVVAATKECFKSGSQISIDHQQIELAVRQ